jgi:hypothetical protein
MFSRSEDESSVRSYGEKKEKLNDKYCAFLEMRKVQYVRSRTVMFQKHA